MPADPFAAPPIDFARPCNASKPMREGKSMFPARKRQGVGFLVASALTALPVAQVSAQSAVNDRWGWGYCAQPYPPPCIERTIDDKAGMEACGKEVQLYMSAVGAFRVCHLKQLERVIREANTVSDTLRCYYEKKGNCVFKQK